MISEQGKISKFNVKYTHNTYAEKLNAFKYNQSTLGYDERNKLIFTAGNDAGIQLFDVNANQIMNTFNINHLCVPNVVCFQPGTNNVIMNHYWNGKISIFPPIDIHKDLSTPLYHIVGKSLELNEGLFYNLYGLDCNQHGHIITSSVGRRIIIFNEKGQHIRSMGKHRTEVPLRRNDKTYCPRQICIDRQNYDQIYVCNNNDKKICIYSSDGSQFIREINLDHSSRTNIVICDHILYVSYGDVISSYDTNSGKKIKSYLLHDMNSGFVFYNVWEICRMEDKILMIHDYKMYLWSPPS